MNIKNSQWDYLCSSPDIFQEIMNELFNSLDYFRTYISRLLIISNKALEGHIKKLDKFLHKLKSTGFKANAKKPFSPEMN